MMFTSPVFCRASSSRDNGLKLDTVVQQTKDSCDLLYVIQIVSWLLLCDTFNFRLPETGVSPDVLNYTLWYSRCEDSSKLVIHNDTICI